MDERQRHFSTWYFLAGILLLLALQNWLLHAHVETLSYSEFKALLHAGKVTDVVLSENSVSGDFSPEGLEGLLPGARLQELKRDGGGPHPFVAVRVADPGLVADLDAAKVHYTGRLDNNWLSTLLSWIVPAIALYVVWSLLMRRMGQASGVLEIGKSKARVYMETNTRVTFADVAGVDEAKEELHEVVNFLKQPREYGRLGARLPKGVLLVGAPGTGKTLLARAVAGEAGVPFFSINGSEFVEMFVGVGAARVRDLFERARQHAPAIIFIDELDALGRARGTFGLGGHDEKEQTLNQLLSELDGFDSSVGLVLLAATNRPEILDQALLRAGRFDRQIVVERPDRHGRVQILNVHLRKVQCAADLDVEKIAALTPGFTGADLANLVNEAALGATRHQRHAVIVEDFTAAIERIVAGHERKNRLMSESERKVVAHHELGHAIVAISQHSSDLVEKVSIIPRGVAALGYTLQRPTEDRFLMTRDELKVKMTSLLGGRAAEALTFGDVSTGAADDLAKATEIARAMVTQFGMDATLGNVSYSNGRSTHLQIPQLPSERAYSEHTAQEIDAAVRTLIQDSYDRAASILKAQRAILGRWAERLLEQETLDESQLALLKEELAATAKPAASALLSGAAQATSQPETTTHR